MVPFPACPSLNLPNTPPKEWKLREFIIPVFSIEWVSKTIIKFDSQAVRRGDKLAIAGLQAQLLDLLGDWKRPEWIEGDWSKINDMTFIELRQSKQQETATILNCTCLSCPNFVTHVSIPQAFGCEFRLTFFCSLLCDMKNFYFRIIFPS